MEANSVSRTPAVSLPRSRRLLAALSDDRLVDQVRRGSDAAFEAIYDRYSGGILGFCRHMLASADEAEDAVQHTFIQAYDSIRRGERELKLKAWLYTIARNRCISILRARREQAAELGDLPTAGLSDDVQRRSDLRELLADIRALPEEQRAALVLAEVGDLSHPEIATVVGCEVNKVKALVYQARTSLIETRNARAIPCAEIREQLATARGGALRRGPLRRHVKECGGCAEFRREVQAQRRMLAVALPVVPSIALKKSALAAIGLGGGGGAAGVAGGGAAGGGLASLIGSTGASKAIAVVALAGATAAGGVALSEQGGRADSRGPGAAAQDKSFGRDPGTPISTLKERDAAAAARRDAAGAKPPAGAGERRDGGAGEKAKGGPHAGAGSSQPGKSGGRKGNGRAEAPGQTTAPGAPPAGTPNGNANGHGNGNGGGGPSNAGGNGNAGTKPTGNNGNHTGAVRGNGNGPAYGHNGTPVGPSKPERTAPATEPAAPVKPEKPTKPPKDKVTE